MTLRCSEEEILTLIKDADELAKNASNKSIKIFANRSDMMRDAYEKYAQAINFCKYNKNIKLASELADKKLILLQKIPEVEQYEIANEYITLAELQEKFEINLAIKSYEKAINIFLKIGKYNNMKKYLIKIAKLHEKNGDLENALKYYIDSTSDEDQYNYPAYIEIAKLSSQLDKFDMALEYYYKIINYCLDNKLLKFSYKGHYLNATLCGIRAHGLAYKEKFTEFLQTQGFEDSIEGKLLSGIFTSIEDDDPEMFSKVLIEYENLKGLDDLQVKLLLAIKKDTFEKQDELL